ncbi:MAG: hypothetical protein ABF271_01870 [Abyssibacter sp.]|jgi:hypothetical protein|uniref:hypothetical protein n=1 Tax=Abyssibacter sp. TaxID=2320200 RepID=UPI00321A2716
MQSKTLIMAALPLIATGCASTPCDLDEPYHRAVAYPYLKDAAGVKAPEPTDEFRIPDVPETVEFARADAEAGDGVCHEVPAPLPEFDAAPPAAADEAVESEQG